MFEKLLSKGFQIEFPSHAKAILLPDSIVTFHEGKAALAEAQADDQDDTADRPQ